MLIQVQVGLLQTPRAGFTGIKANQEHDADRYRRDERQDNRNGQNDCADQQKASHSETDFRHIPVVVASSVAPGEATSGDWLRMANYPARCRRARTIAGLPATVSRSCHQSPRCGSLAGLADLRRNRGLDRSCVAVEERSVALQGLRDDGPAISRVAGDDVKVEVEDRLEGDFAVTEEDVDSLATHA